MLKIQNLEDEELIFFIRLQDEDALNILLERYKFKSRKLVQNIVTQFPNTGIPFEVLENVALNAVIIAIKNYEEQGKTFFSYWYSIAKREAQDYIRHNSYTVKSPGFVGISMDSTVDSSNNDTGMIADSIGEIDNNLDVNLLLREFLKVIKADRNLRRLEKEVFYLYLKGYQKEEIIKMCHCSKATYYRIVERCKKVLAKHYQNKL